ncbi:MAG: alkaline phosphatase [Methylohalobius sp.]
MKVKLIVFCLVALGACTHALDWQLAEPDSAAFPSQWFVQGQAKAKFQERTLKPVSHRARNIVLFVGDGMGITTVTAARILEGQLKGHYGEENLLSFERFPYTALVKTYEVDQQVPDSAGTMTAMMIGVKTKAGLIGLDQTASRGDCPSAREAERRTLLEEAESLGLSTGVVTTTRLTHATPAATFAHVPERDWESDADMPESAKRTGCKDIARQLIEFPYGDGLEVALGGGRQKFLPASAHDPEYPDQTGSRTDGRHLIEEWQARPRWAYVWNKEQFDALDPAKVDHLLGLFEPSHLHYEHDRLLDTAGEPSLSEMTAKAIQILKRNPTGFFLMVEGGRIDHAHHAGNAFRALTETIELARAVEVALKMTDPKDTLIVVTADHSQPLVLAGYPRRGNPILGKVEAKEGKLAKAADGWPYTVLVYANGRGAHVLPRGGDAVFALPIHPGRLDLRQVNTQLPGYHQEALVPLEASTHAGEDVPLYAGGAGAQLFRGVLEQHAIYHLLRRAAGF